MRFDLQSADVPEQRRNFFLLFAPTRTPSRPAPCLTPSLISRLSSLRAPPPISISGVGYFDTTGAACDLCHSSSNSSYANRAIRSASSGTSTPYELGTVPWQHTQVNLSSSSLPRVAAPETVPSRKRIGVLLNADPPFTRTLSLSEKGTLLPHLNRRLGPTR